MVAGTARVSFGASSMPAMVTAPTMTAGPCQCIGEKTSLARAPRNFGTWLRKISTPTPLR